ncbi:4-hydroxyphenylacetate permease [uncultured Anaerobiospirillum sp.]|uniref:4-hydroxyphenylacetate permease n=1 Tax=uncultured Anaerobiospirillum sp. TaxID=265728 RepID=UPI002805749C|nr:4-hydroxyphenylacetate permease [uncultured Anaerobiospirillum sp.]
MSLTKENPAQQHEQYNDEQKAVIKKLFTRLILFLFILFVFSFLDRINIGFAALTMGEDIGIDATAFGMAMTLFYVTYLIGGIPSNVILSIMGARKWIAIIMVAWGFASTATMFAQGPTSLYIIRMIVGITEAGFLPGILLYLTYWFPSFFRARANALFIIAMPFTAAIGSAVSGFLLQMDGIWGLAGWQWLFFLEGFPAVILGVFVWYYLCDSPDKAQWLNDREKEVLKDMIEKDRLSLVQPEGPKSHTALQHESRWKGIFTAPVILYTIAYFCLCNSLSASNVWAPMIIKNVAGADTSNTIIGILAGIPHLATILLMLVWSRSSDSMQERKWHTFIPYLIAMSGWLMCAVMNDPTYQYVGIIIATAGSFTAMVLFWTTPDQNISDNARAVAIAIINSVGNIGSGIGPLIIGILFDKTGTFESGLIYISALLIIGSILILFIPMTRSRPRATP